MVAQAAGLMEFAKWILKTPYTTTPIGSVLRCTQVDLEGNKGAVLMGIQAGGVNPLQRLEDSISHLCGEIGVGATDAQYLTLHGGVGGLGENYVCLQQELVTLGSNLLMAALRMEGAWDKAPQAKTLATTLGDNIDKLHRQVSLRALEGLYRELQEDKVERGILRSTVLTLTAAVTSLLEDAATQHAANIAPQDFELCLKAQEKAVNRWLDSICHEMKGGRITVGRIAFSGREAAMDWARIHLPPNTYQCIDRMIYTMFLIFEAIVHQEDMIKCKEHRVRV